MKVLVTGGSGFVGHELIVRLLYTGHEVINVDLNPSHHNDIVEYVHDLTTGPTDVGEFDYCIHLASAAGGLLFNQKHNLVPYNDAINKSVVKMCKNTPLLFVSTLNVFENTTGSLTNFPPPSTPYAMSKLVGEKLFEEYCDVSIFRPCNIFGKSQLSHIGRYGESHVIPDLVAKIKNEDVVEVWGDGTQKRSFLHVVDFSDVLISHMSTGKSYDRNLCSNIITSIKELVYQLMFRLQSKKTVTFLPEYMKYENMFIENILSRLEIVGHVKSITEGLDL